MGAIVAFIWVIFVIGCFFASLGLAIALAIGFIDVASSCVEYTVRWFQSDPVVEEPTPAEPFPAGTFIPLRNMALELCPICLEELAQNDHKYCGVCGVGYHVECMEYFGGRCTTMGCRNQ
jgi:hypothetical protein